MIWMLTLLSALWIGPQEGAPATPAAEEGWQLLNRIGLVVDERIYTSAELHTFVRMQDRPRTTPEELAQALKEVRTLLVARLLAAQAGDDLGVDPEVLDRIVKENLEVEKERRGGIAGMSEYLQQTGVTSSQLKEQRRDRMMSELWERSVTGKVAGPLGRPSRDRFVRPGLLKMVYREMLPSLTEPAGVRVLDLTLPLQRWGGLEATLAQAEALRVRVEEGEDFRSLISDYGPPGAAQALESDPPWADPASICQIVPGLADFLEQASPGDVSTPVPFERDGEVVGLSLIQLVDRREERAPSFASHETQAMVRERYQETYWNLRVDQGLEELARAAYVWPAMERQPARPNNGQLSSN